MSASGDALHVPSDASQSRQAASRAEAPSQIRSALSGWPRCFSHRAHAAASTTAARVVHILAWYRRR